MKSIIYLIVNSQYIEYNYKIVNFSSLCFEQNEYSVSLTCYVWSGPHNYLIYILLLRLMTTHT